MNDSVENVQPLGASSIVFKILGWAGFYWLNKPKYGWKLIFQLIYKPLVLFFIAVYNLQHIAYLILNRHDENKLMDCLMLEIPHCNLLVKVGSLFLKTSRVDKLNIYLKEEATFHSSNIEDQTVLKKHNEKFLRLTRFIMISASFSAVFWQASLIVKRYNDPTETVPIYVPFATDTWFGFLLSAFVGCCTPLLWTCYGHLSLDILVSIYYAHGQVLLKIIKRELRHLHVEPESGTHTKNNFQYRDSTNDDINKRFIRIVKNYGKLVWYKNEVGEIFDLPLLFQFFSYTATICIVIYRMTLFNVASYPFAFLASLLTICLAQVFVFCYFGNRLEYESRYINTSLYRSDWLALSPRFRRQMLIAMCYWSQSLQPRVFKIIPLSLDTFVAISKSAYSLYTVLVAAKPST